MNQQNDTPNTEPTAMAADIELKSPDFAQLSDSSQAAAVGNGSLQVQPT